MVWGGGIHPLVEEGFYEIHISPKSRVRSDWLRVWLHSPHIKPKFARSMQLKLHHICRAVGSILHWTLALM
jgi:hypothetical protein